MKLTISTVCALALFTSCRSLRPLPKDDKSSSQWLEISGGEFWCTSRTVVTDKEFVNEYYVRINRGKREGVHALKEQKIIPLSAQDAESFWQSIDRLKILTWSEADMPQRTDRPSLTYRKYSQSIELQSPTSDHSGGERFEALQAKIAELGQRSLGETVE